MPVANGASGWIARNEASRGGSERYAAQIAFACGRCVMEDVGYAGLALNSLKGRSKTAEIGGLKCKGNMKFEIRPITNRTKIHNSFRQMTFSFSILPCIAVIRSRQWSFIKYES